MISQKVIEYLENKFCRWIEQYLSYIEIYTTFQIVMAKGLNFINRNPHVFWFLNQKGVGISEGRMHKSLPRRRSVTRIAASQSASASRTTNPLPPPAPFIRHHTSTPVSHHTPFQTSRLSSAPTAPSSPSLPLRSPRAAPAPRAPHGSRRPR